MRSRSIGLYRAFICSAEGGAKETPNFGTAVRNSRRPELVVDHYPTEDQGWLTASQFRWSFVEPGPFPQVD